MTEQSSGQTRPSHTEPPGQGTAVIMLDGVTYVLDLTLDEKAMLRRAIDPFLKVCKERILNQAAQCGIGTASRAQADQMVHRDVHGRSYPVGLSWLEPGDPRVALPSPRAGAHHPCRA